MERKLVITGCGNCPFVKFNPMDEIQHFCSKFSLTLDEPYNKEKIHDQCLLPINIKSENIIK